MGGTQEFETPQDALAHYGRKGMKWGVITEDKSGGSGSGKSAGKKKPVETDVETLKKVSDAFYATKDKAELQAEGQKKLEAQAKSTFPSKKEVKRAAKAEKTEATAAELDARISNLKDQSAATKPGLKGALQRNHLDSQIHDAELRRNSLEKRAEQLREGKLTDRQKAAIIGVGAAAAVTGLALYGNHKVSTFKAEQLAENQRQTNKQWNDLFGKDHNGVPFTDLTESPGSGFSFYQGLSNKKAYDRPEFTIPEGTIFQRLSNHPEDATEYGKLKGAYATFLHNDKKLYGVSGEFGNAKYNVNFESNGPTRVPKLATVLAHLKEVQKAEYPDQPSRWSDTAVYTEYHSMAGGSWADSKSIRLFDSLRQFGYGAIVDDMDAGYLGDLPIVFFGQAKNSVATERVLTDRGNDRAGLLKLSGQYA